MIIPCNIPNIQTYFFDFDGVLVDSVDIKTHAYQEIFESHGKQAVDEITKYHLENGGIDRFRKIEFVLNKLGRSSKEEIDRLTDQFSKRVMDAVIATSEIPMGRRLLDYALDSNIDCHIVSGTPQDELQKIVTARNLNESFFSVNGSPREKTSILKKLISENGYECSRCLMIGDAMTDFVASQEAGIWFFGFPQIASEYD